MENAKRKYAKLWNTTEKNNLWILGIADVERNKFEIQIKELKKYFFISTKM